jgi:hypothetical protein
MKLNTKKIEAERKRIGETKTAFAARIGMSVSAYCRVIDKATTKIKTISAIANALHLDPRDLLSR